MNLYGIGGLYYRNDIVESTAVTFGGNETVIGAVTFPKGGLTGLIMMDSPTDFNKFDKKINLAQYPEEEKVFVLFDTVESIDIAIKTLSLAKEKLIDLQSKAADHD